MRLPLIHVNDGKRGPTTAQIYNKEQKKVRKTHIREAGFRSMAGIVGVSGWGIDVEAGFAEAGRYLICRHVFEPGRQPAARPLRCPHSALMMRRRRWWNPGGWPDWSSAPCWRCPGWRWGYPHPGRPPPPNRTRCLSGGAERRGGRGLVRVTQTHSTLSPEGGQVQLKSTWKGICNPLDGFLNEK